MQVVSNLTAPMTFTGAGLVGPRKAKGVTIRPGVNHLTNPQWEVLKIQTMNKGTVFARHLASGAVQMIGAKPAAPVAPPKPAPSPAAIDAAKALEDQESAFLDVYSAMTPDEQAALYPTLPDNEKAIIDAAKAKVSA
jgi:hypothetical protein